MVVAEPSTRMTTSCRSSSSRYGPDHASWTTSPPGKWQAGHGGASNTTTTPGSALPSGPRFWLASGVGAITVFLADDSVIIREGVQRHARRATRTSRSSASPRTTTGWSRGGRGPSRRRRQRHPHATALPARGHRRCKEIRKRHPGTGIVILSQYDDPDYAVSLLSEGSAGYAYLLKDRIAEGDQLARAIREVATGGSMLDPAIVTALINPVRRTGGLEPGGRRAARAGGDGRTIKAIAAAREDDRGRRRGRRRAAVRQRSPRRVGGRGRRRSIGCAACTRRSSSARSRARR